MYSSSWEEAKAGYKFTLSPITESNPITNKDLELQIKTLQNASRDEDKLEWLLKAKEERQNQEAMHIEDT